MTHSPTALTRKDIGQIAIGSAALAFPVATTEEVWNLSAEISTLRILTIGLVSLFIVGTFVAVVYEHAAEGFPNRGDFLRRIAAVYGVTLVVCAGILGLLDRLPLLTDLSVAIHRTVLVAFPASFSATVVDSLG